jgi:hypothetical protein
MTWASQKDALMPRWHPLRLQAVQLQVVTAAAVAAVAV